MKHFTVILFTLIASCFAVQADSPIKKVLKSPSRSAVLTIDSNKNLITVELDQSMKHDPKSVKITVYDKNNESTTYDLRAIDKSTYTGSWPNEALSTLNRSPVLAQESITGIEFSIPLVGDASETFRLSPGTQ